MATIESLEREQELIALRNQALEKKRRLLQAQLDTTIDEMNHNSEKALQLIKENMKLQLMKEREKENGSNKKTHQI